MRSLSLAMTFAFCTALCSVGLLLIGSRIFGPLPLSITQTTTQKESAFSVTGEAEIAVVPDTAEINLGVRVNRATVTEAQNEVNRVMSDLSTKITQLGVDKKDIRTTNYSVNPEYDYTNGSRGANGFTVSSTVSVQLQNFELVNQVIDLATSSGINEVNGITFTLSEQKEEQLKKEAREQAIQKAKASAEELSRLAGMKLGKIINVSESKAPGNPIYRTEALNLAVGDTVQNRPTTIEPGLSTYTYSITLSYETL